MKRSATDDVLLAAVRAAMAISVQAADVIGDLSPVQLRALTVLRDQPGANLASLAQELGVTVSTTSRLVDRLIAAGLAERRPSPQTRREVSLSLSRAGRASLARYDRYRLTELRACLERVPADRRDEVVTALRLLLQPAAHPSADTASTV